MFTYSAWSRFSIALVYLLSTRAQASGVEPVNPGQLHAMVMLAVSKAKLTAELRTLEEPGLRSQLLHTFKVAIGRGTGDKMREGDNKTPEGLYFTKRHIGPRNLLRSKYGEKAIPLDFPNMVDLLEGKTGHGIWLHGAGNDARIAESKVTEGCVAFYNADILKLDHWIRPNQSLVVVARDHHLVNQDEEMAEVWQQSKEWLAAWKSRDIKTYMSFYDSQFVNAGRGKTSYGKYKQRVFSSYKNIRIDISQLRVVTHPKYALTYLNQDFFGDDRFKSLGRKILYWRKTLDGWKILREHFDRHKFSPLEISNLDLQRLKANPTVSSTSSASKLNHNL